MNVDTGHIKYWSDLSTEERDSGRWVKLGDGEYATAVTMEEHERVQRLNEIFSGFPKTREVVPDIGTGLQKNWKSYSPVGSCDNRS